MGQPGEEATWAPLHRYVFKCVTLLSENDMLFMGSLSQWGEKVFPGFALHPESHTLLLNINNILFKCVCHVNLSIC